MSELRLAANEVGFEYNFGNGHFQLVLANGNNTQSEIEVQASDTDPKYLSGPWTYPKIRDHTGSTDGKAHTPHVGDGEMYASYTFTREDLGGRSPDSVWAILGQVHDNFAQKGMHITYDLEQNSNSYIRTILSVVGIDVDKFAAEATPESVSRFWGLGTNVLENAGNAIPLNISGTVEGDIIRTGVDNDQISGFYGKDKLDTGGGDDTVSGGGENDTIDGGADIDGADIDTAVFADIEKNYEKLKTADGNLIIGHVGGSREDGVDTLKNIERLQFADLSIDVEKFSFRPIQLTTDAKIAPWPEQPSDSAVEEQLASDSAVEELVNLARETYIGPTLSPLISEPGSRLEPPKDAPVPENEQIHPGAPPTGSSPEPVGVALKDLPPPPAVPVPPSAPPPSAEESAPEPGIVQIHPGAPPTGSAPEPGPRPEPGPGVQNLGGKPPTGSTPEPGPRPEPPASDTVQDLGGGKPSGDDTTEDEKLAFSDLPPPPDIPPPPPPSFSPGSAPEPGPRPEPPASDTVQDLGGNEPTVPNMESSSSPMPDDILLA